MSHRKGLGARVLALCAFVSVLLAILIPAFAQNPGGSAQGPGVNPLRLFRQTTDPSTVSTLGSVYTKDVAGDTELFYKDGLGNIIQMTSGGTALASSTAPPTFAIPYAFVSTGAAGVVTCSAAAATNGQLLIGATGASPTAATLTAVANRTVITNAANSITCIGVTRSRETRRKIS
jgi:hypothetical protein